MSDESSSQKERRPDRAAFVIAAVLAIVAANIAVKPFTGMPSA